MIGVVLDTNVVVSALLNGDGLEAMVIDLALARELRVAASEAILEEYRLTLSRPKFSEIDPKHIEYSLTALRNCRTHRAISATRGFTARTGQPLSRMR